MSTNVLWVVWIVIVIGFINSYQACENGQQPCILNATHGNITSPGYPYRYPNNANLSWLIQAPQGYSVKLTFHSFELEKHCLFDSLSIYDGPSYTESPLMGQYCGPERPPEQLSTGTQLLVVFTSDISFVRSGFNISYKALQTASSCLTTQTIEENTNILLQQSPGSLQVRPGSNVTRIQCQWRLRAPQGYGIRIIFSSLHVVKNASCSQGGVGLYSGYSLEQKDLIQRYCSGNILTNATTYNPRRTLLISLSVNISQWDENVFGVSYKFIKKDLGKCSNLNSQAENNDIQLSGESGNFSLQGSKQTKSQCRWKISAPSGYYVRLSFTNFRLYNDCSQSFIKIFDRREKGTFCGPASPWVIYSTVGYLSVSFVNNGASGEPWSFTVLYTSVREAVGRCSTMNSKEMNSNIHLEGKSGILMTPDYPYSYPNSLQCIWTITVPSKYRVKLHFVAFEIEDHDSCTYDFVEIRDGNTSEDPTKGKLCGRYKLPNDVYSSSNHLWVLFQSDSSHQMKGFQAFFSVAVPEPGKCSVVNTAQENSNIAITSVSGFLTSPNYPQAYPPEIKCTWHITVPKPSRVLVHFYDFKLSQSRCGNEYLEAYDGNCSCDKSLGRHCGRDLPNNVISSGNSMTLVLKTVDRTDFHGFNLSYSFLHVGPGTCSSGNPQAINDNLVVNNSRGQITSPDYPFPYPRGVRCTWLARAPLGYHVQLSFSYMNLPTPCFHDYLDVRDGGSSPSKGKYCGVDRSSRIYSSSRDLWVRFTSRPPSTNTEYRFIMNYRMIKAGTCSKEFAESWNSNLDLEGSKVGILSSPGYPRLYPSDMRCSWKITVPNGYRVRLYFTYLSMNGPCNSDFVDVRDGLYTFSKQLKKFCESQPTVEIVSSGRYLLLHFESGNRTKRIDEGFEAKFVAFENDQPNESTFVDVIVLILMVVGGIVLLALSLLFIYWLVNKRYRRRNHPRSPRDQDLTVLSPMPEPPLDDIPDCLIAEDRPPSYSEAMHAGDGQGSTQVEVVPDASHNDGETGAERQPEAEQGLDNPAFLSDPPTYESLYGIDPS